MSRVGKHAVSLPSGVQCQISGENLTLKGKLGQLSMVLSPLVNVKASESEITVTPTSESKESRMMWGTARNLLANLVKGVSVGFERKLEINGVGYRAAMQASDLVLQLGYSHEIRYPVPQGIKITCEKPTSILVEGMDKQRVGQVAAEIRSYRKPEPYKGKGIRFEDEYVVRKEGKKK
ncbi:MAG: 50S ribosomal protein L6 [Alphaproteobacteria bacterium]|nr:50S ribosomal protein L6 [Alphaproteobacteria bacterium]